LVRIVRKTDVKELVSEALVNEELIDEELVIDERYCGIIGEDVEFQPIFNTGCDVTPDTINEASTITFEGKPYPKGGWMVIMAGGAGSGKGTVSGLQILINARVLDVDAMKLLYNAANTKKNDDELSKNADFTQALSDLLKDPEFKKSADNIKKVADIMKKSVNKFTGVGMTEDEAWKDLAWNQLRNNYDKTYKEFNFKNSEDVAQLHGTIGSSRVDKDTGEVKKSLKSSRTDAFYGEVGKLSSENQKLYDDIQTAKKDGKPLPNVILDVTGKDDVHLDAADAVAMGYKVSVVWVLTNRQWAMYRNLSRERVVGQDLFHNIHNMVKNHMMGLLDNSGMDKNGKLTTNKDIDEFWIVFSGDNGAVKAADKPIATTDLEGTVVKLVRTGSEFKFPIKLLNDVEKKYEEQLMDTGDFKKGLEDFLGPDEVDPKSPKVYVDFKTMGDKMKNVKDTKSKDWKINALKNPDAGDAKNVKSLKDLAKTKESKRMVRINAIKNKSIKEGFDYDLGVVYEGAEMGFEIHDEYDVDTIVVAFTEFAKGFKSLQDAADSVDDFVTAYFVGSDAENFRNFVRTNYRDIAHGVAENVGESIARKFLTV
jgi:hypothetical protein